MGPSETDLPTLLCLPATSEGNYMISSARCVWLQENAHGREPSIGNEGSGNHACLPQRSRLTTLIIEKGQLGFEFLPCYSQ